jgi:hypothetical protein
VRVLQRRRVDAAGHAWGDALLDGWETRHPVFPLLIGADALALTPCIGRLEEPIVQVNNRTESIHFFAGIELAVLGGSLHTHAWPCESTGDGNYRCPRLEVRGANGNLLVLATNAWFLDYGPSKAASSSAALTLHQVGT